MSDPDTPKGRHSGRRRADEALLQALAVGQTVRAAAKAAGVAEATAFRRLREPGFAERLRAAKAEFARRTLDALTAAGLKAVATLVAVNDDRTASAVVRVSAARALLELGHRLREAAGLQDIQARLAALEGQQAFTPRELA